MKVQTEHIALSLWVVGEDVTGNQCPVIFLHGMTLSGKEWEPVIGRLSPEWPCIAPDLIGHGGTGAPDQPEPYRIDEVVDQLIAMLDSMGIESAHWVGYSMGGRILFHLALNYQKRVQSMILESTTAGIEGEDAREKRRRKDGKLADYLESKGMEAFVELWLSAPIFESQQDLPGLREWGRQIRRDNNPRGVARCLRQLGRGQVPQLWDRLTELTLPVMLITGELDKKHVKIHERMKRKLPHVRAEVVEGAGHNVHLESPDRFVELSRSFLTGEAGE